MAPPETIKEKVKKLFTNEETGKTVTDEQTGKCYELLTEAVWDIAAATFSVLYLLTAMFFLVWALFDIYHGQNQVLTRFFSEDTIYPDSPLARLIAYAVIGGALGSVVNGFRSLLSWHADRRAFGWRYVWKYVTLPPLGGVLAAIVYAVVHCGIGVLGADFTQGGATTNQALSAFAIGALAGYGCQKTFKWLDEHVNRVFSTIRAEVKTPNLSGKTKEKAETALEAIGLKLGNVDSKTDPDKAKAGKVVAQDPLPDTKISRGGAVKITLAKKA